MVEFSTIIVASCRVYNHIKPPSQIYGGCDYMLFKVKIMDNELIIFEQEGIEPMWEDETNKHGGRWLLNIDKRERKEGVLDNIWMETVNNYN